MEITPPFLAPSKIISAAMYQSLKLLSDMAAIRLDEKPDRIESVLHSSLIDRTSAATSSQYISDREASGDPLASSTWEEVVYIVIFVEPEFCC